MSDELRIAIGAIAKVQQEHPECALEIISLAGEMMNPMIKAEPKMEIALGALDFIRDCLEQKMKGEQR